ncbi:hypothetical protein NUW58_g1344 [Xylaria curta]|uniref:Uncharacterized protein n=1 Tax=Xylaria curta TaxID=42375 RepID=A0ACC1PKK4_9PEZI|nr:hypothetical protein NUW58_g1344 [Xylaria curta]
MPHPVWSALPSDPGNAMPLFHPNSPGPRLAAIIEMVVAVTPHRKRAAKLIRKPEQQRTKPDVGPLYVCRNWQLALLMISTLKLSKRVWQAIMGAVDLDWPVAGQDEEYLETQRLAVNDELVGPSELSQFMPESSIRRVLDNIRFDVLLPGASEDLIDFICTDARKVFLIALVSLDCSGSNLLEVVKDFRKNAFTDSLLPVENIAIRGKCAHPKLCRRTNSFDPYSRDKGNASCAHLPALSSFHKKQWSVLGINHFYLFQWRLIAPVFKKESIQRFGQELPEYTILPLISKEEKPCSGHFSDVFRAQLHADHQDTLDPNEKNEVDVALKELKNSIVGERAYKVEEAWQRETETLDELGKLNHPHLIRCIASFKLRARGHYIMFEWANGGTLRDLWAKDPKAHIDLNGNRIKEFLKQLYGLASALRALHGTNTQTATGIADGQIGRLGSQSQAVQNWRHGDLKPENILVFENSSWLGILKMADFGLAKQHDAATALRAEVTSTEHTTLHYEAPEAVTNKTEPRSRRYDIWSMGCIILESVIWLLYGSDVLDIFYDEKKHLRSRPQHTLYFTIKTDEGGSNPVATVSATVKHWISEILKKDPECSQPTALRELLELVRDKLLVVKIPSKSKPSGIPVRATASDLLKGVETIMRAAEDDDEYLFTGMRRSLVRPPSSSNASRRYLDVSRPLTHRPAQHAMFDNTWESLDDKFPAWLMETVGSNALSIFPEGKSSLCERCIALDFESIGVIVSGEYTFLISSTKNAGSLEFWRIKNGLGLQKTRSELLSIYGTPSLHATSNKQSQGIPIEIPKLVATASQTYFDILRQWLKDCDENHVGCRLESTDASLIRIPTRLINVGEMGSPVVYLLETQLSQVLPSQNFRYIALSHPWGDRAEHTHYFTTLRNINRHKSGMHISALPNTFKDAIRVAQELGVRYLWIDSLCIVQGEDGDFADEAKHMETVFSSAYCVIAATRAKGMSSGFLGSRPLRKVARFERLGDPFYVCEPIDNFQRDVIEGALNKRGWVLQERALARRTIYFAENQTYWECGDGVRCETLSRMRNNQAALLGDPNFPRVATDSSKGGRIRLYELLYKQYSRLQFTRISDRPLAIAGIEQRLIRAFDTQGGYGVFNCYFGRGLLWQRDVTVASGAMKPIQFPQSQRYQVPSWSWMAYEGAITFMDLPFGEIEWEEKEVRSPWNPPGPILASSSRISNKSNSSWYTGDTNGRVDLTVTARDFSLSADTHIVYDRGERPGDRIAKCVIVGRRKSAAEVDTQRIHYVLVVAQKQDAGSKAQYERIGAGSLPGSAITKGANLQVQVF